MPNSPFGPIQRRLHILLGRLDQGKMMTNLQLHFDANLPESYLECFRTGVNDLLTRSSCLKGLTLGGRCGYIEIPHMIGGTSPSFRLSELSLHLRVTPELWDLVFSQPTIRRLVLNHCFKPPYVHYRPPDIPSQIPTNALPQLEALLAPIEIVTALLPGRPVKYVAVQCRDTSSPSALEFLWQAVEESSAALTALSIRADSTIAFRSLLQELPRRTPSLRFLGINIAGSTRRWTPRPNAGDLGLLSSLTMLECIRWESTPDPRCFSNPADYAGTSLRHVQHEVCSLWSSPQGLHEYEGAWEIVNKKGRTYWKLKPFFLAPRVDHRTRGLVCIVNSFLI